MLKTDFRYQMIINTNLTKRKVFARLIAENKVAPKYNRLLAGYNRLKSCSILVFTNDRSLCHSQLM